MLSLKQERTNHSQLISRFVLLAALVLAVIAVFSVPNNKAALAVPKVSPQLLGELGSSSEVVPVLITTESHDYEAIVQAIEEAGGTVTQQYKYATGLAAELPKDAILSISELPGVQRVQTDSPRQLETGSTTADAIGGILPLGSDMEAVDGAMRLGAGTPFDASGFETTSLSLADLSDIDPTTYNTPFVMDAVDVWSTGNLGQDSLAVVIDTGIYSEHFMLAGSVIGGEDMSADAGTPYEGFDKAANHWHGTHVSGIIAGHGAVVLPNDDLLTQSIEMNTGRPLPTYDADNKILPLLGNAPFAQLYGIKVFDHTGGSASESIIIGAIERAIDLKLEEGLDVDVINMSLGGWTGYDGRDLEDMAVDAATDAGITVVVAASNDGPTSLTINSPGTANTSVAVGAAALPANVRVFWDVFYDFLGIGEYLFTSDQPQMIYFSSRGPTADGRMKPEVSGSGVFVLSAFNTDANPQGIGWASGTSMASPSVAGVAALLNTYGETVGASPGDIKEALINGSNMLPGYDKYDQGAGLVSAADAMAALEDDHDLGTTQAPLPPRRNDRPSAMPKGQYLSVGALRRGVTIDVKDLAPGEAQHYWIKMRPGIERIKIDVTNVDVGVDPFGINSFELYVSSAVRSGNVSYIDSANVSGDAQFVIEDLNTQASGDIFGAFLEDLPMMTGYIRLVIENDWTSFDNLSGTFTIKTVHGRNNAKDEFYRGTLNTGESEGFFPVGFGPNGVRLDLFWRRNHSQYSTSDLDMIVVWIDTDGNQHVEYGGATINAPEELVIEADNMAAVYVLVDGYNTYDKDEMWKLKVNYLGD